MRRLIIGSVFLLAFSALIYSCQDSTEIDFDNYYTNGMEIYKKSCQNCHGAKGEGLGELAPPLTDTLFLAKYKPQLACFIKNGMHEQLLINNKLYNEKMPAFSDMNDVDMAQVIVYITNSFGNKQGLYRYSLISKDLQACK